METLTKVLCVNDSEINSLIMKRLISKTFFAEEVINVYNGQQALDYYLKLIEDPPEEASAPGLILLDIEMPEMDGWEFLDRFCSSFLPLFPDTKVIITSFSVDDKDFEKAKKYSCVIDFLNKPLTAGYLEALEF
jgi:CheY-like chemotaxis protein